MQVGMVRAVVIHRIVDGPDMRVLLEEGLPEVRRQLKALVRGQLTGQRNLEAPGDRGALALVHIRRGKKPGATRSPRR